MAITAVKECLLHLFLVDLNEECNKLCQKSEISIFRKMDVAQAMEFQWAPFITELQTKSPLSTPLQSPLHKSTKSTKSPLKD